MKKSSRVTQKGQATIPSEVRKFLQVGTGDLVSFEVINNRVVVSKSTPLDIQYHHGIQKTLEKEWLSNDDSVYDDM